MPFEIILHRLDVRLCPDLDTLVAVIAHSEIVVAKPLERLPAGFDKVDIAILDWIASEGRRVGQRFVLM
jgi:hypothetical protein